MPEPQDRFWETLSLHQLSTEQWEALCDGCGRCCLVKLEDEDSGRIVYTNVACFLLDPNTCRCRDYDSRSEKVPGCLILSADRPEIFAMLPNTCAYRLRHEGKPLPAWHPLLSGDPRSVVEAGISVTGRVISEEYIHEEQLSQQIIDWIHL